MGLIEAGLVQNVKNLIRGLSFGRGIKTPKTVTDLIYLDNGYLPSSGLDFLTPAKDGSFIRIGADQVSDIRLYNAAGSLVWTVTKTDIDATATHLVNGFVWDITDNVIYICGFKANNVYFASINISTGGVTNINTIAVTNLNVGLTSLGYGSGMTRQLDGGGNFTLTSYQTVTTCYSISFDVTGVITTAEALVNGAYLAYKSNSGSFFGLVSKVTTSNDATSIQTRNQGKLTIPLVSCGLSNTDSVILQIGTYISLRSGVISGTKYLDRVDFERYLEEIETAQTGSQL